MTSCPPVSWASADQRTGWARYVEGKLTTPTSAPMSRRTASTGSVNGPWTPRLWNTTSGGNCSMSGTEIAARSRLDRKDPYRIGDDREEAPQLRAHAALRSWS